MKIKILLILLSFFVCGCSGVEKFSDNYLGGDKYYEGVYHDAKNTFVREYLNANNQKDDFEHIEFLAKKRLLDSKYKNYYLLASARVEYDIGMPEHIKYFYVHFTPIDPRRADYL